MIKSLLFFLLFIPTAQAAKITAEGTDLYFFYCGNGDGYYKKIDWKEVGENKPVHLKKGSDVFRIEVFFTKDELKYYLRKDDLRSNGGFIQSENDISDQEKMTSFGGNFYFVVYAVMKNTVSLPDLLKKVMNQCNDEAKKAQGIGNIDEIKNKRTTKWIELEPSSGNFK